jgi:hypothetical protein
MTKINPGSEGNAMPKVNRLTAGLALKAIAELAAEGSAAINKSTALKNETIATVASEYANAIARQLDRLANSYEL